MKECTIRRFNYDPNGKWLELWLDGLEYTSDEVIWDNESEIVKPTGDKQWNLSCKRGNFESSYEKTFGEPPYYPQIIGLKVLSDGKDINFIKRDKLEEIKESIAREKGFADYSECLLQHTHSFGDLDSLIDEITKRYTSECIKASLRKASENAEGYRDYDFNGVDSDTITNEENIVLL